MDYLKIYNHFYNQTFHATKYIFIEEFKMAKSKNRPFLSMANKILQKLYNYRNEKFTEKLNEKAQISFQIFNERYSYYSGVSDDVISWVLEDEVLKAFKKSLKYPYNHFIEDLAIHESLKEIARHFQNYYDYYGLIYKYDCYDIFYLKDFNGNGFESSKEYKSMVDEKGCKHLLDVPEGVIVELQQSPNEDSPKSQYDLDINNLIKEFVDVKFLESLHTKVVTASSGSEQNTKKDIPKSKYDISTENLLNEFTDDERFLIIHVFYKLIKDDVENKDQKSPRILATDFMKIIKIAGGFVDNTIYYMEAKNNTFYAKVNKGIDYYGVNTRLKILESTISKLQGFKIDVILEEIVQMKTKHVLAQRIG